MRASASGLHFGDRPTGGSPGTIVWFGGRFVDGAEPAAATMPAVPIDDPGYLLGDGVFATLRGYDGVCFRARAHLEPLARGAALFAIPLPVDIVALTALVDEAARGPARKTPTFA